MGHSNEVKCLLMKYVDGLEFFEILYFIKTVGKIASHQNTYINQHRFHPNTTGILATSSKPGKGMSTFVTCTGTIV